MKSAKFIVGFICCVFFFESSAYAEKNATLIQKHVLFVNDSEFISVGLLSKDKSYTFCTYYLSQKGFDSLIDFKNSFESFADKDSFTLVLKKNITEAIEQKFIKNVSLTTANFKRQVEEFYKMSNEKISSTIPIEDKYKCFVSLGANFDFLKPDVDFKLSNVVFGQIRYVNNSLLRNRDKKWDFGAEIGLNSFTSLIQHGVEQHVVHYTTYYSDTQSLTVTNTYNGKRTSGSRQWSFYMEPYYGMRIDKRGSIKFGVGPHFEYYKYSNYSVYSDFVLIDSIGVLKDTIAKNMPVNHFLGFKDSIGYTNDFGFFGVAVPITITEPLLEIRTNLVFGRIIGKAYSRSNEVTFAGKQTFYYIFGCFTYTKLNIAIQTTIRGALQPSESKSFGNVKPVTSVCVIKNFEINNLANDIKSLIK